MRKLRIFAVLFILFTGWQIKAQKIRPVSKERVLQSVMENNESLKITEQEFLQARADYRQTNAFFLPDISISHTGITTNSPFIAFGSKLNQERVTHSDLEPELLNDPGRFSSFNTFIEVEQPLINLDGIFKHKAANSRMKARLLQNKRIAEYLEFEVNKAYMELQLAYKAIQLLENAYEDELSIKKLANERYKMHYLEKADILSVEVRISEIRNRLHAAKTNLENASDYLEFLMGQSQEGTLKPTDSFQVNTIKDSGELGVSEERSDIKALELLTEARKKMYTANKMNFLPRLNAYGSYEFYDEEVFQGEASAYLAGISLSWEIFQGFKRLGELQKSRSEFEKAKLKYEEYVSKSTMELKKARRALKDAEYKLKLSELAMQQSEESLRIRTRRFGDGLENTSDLLVAEAKYLEKELEYYQTIFEYNYTRAYLEFLTEI